MVKEMSAFLRGLDPDLVSTAQARRALRAVRRARRLARPVRCCLAPGWSSPTPGRTKATAPRRHGWRRPPGTGLGDAIATLETADGSGRSRGTTEALRNGALSAPQVREIAAAAASVPQSEVELIGAAATCT